MKKPARTAQAYTQKNTPVSQSSKCLVHRGIVLPGKVYFTYSMVYSKPYSSWSFLTAGSQSSMKVGA